MAEIPRGDHRETCGKSFVEVGQMIAEGDEICILESMKMEIPVITEVPGCRARARRRAGPRTVQEGDRIALIDES